MNDYENIFELYPTEYLRDLLRRLETVEKDIEDWKNKCRDIEDATKKFNDDLMIKINEDEKNINKHLYDEIDKIKHAIDLIGEDLKPKYKEYKKDNNFVSNRNSNPTILSIFYDPKRNQALARCNSIYAEIRIIIKNKLGPLFQKLIEYPEFP